MKSPVYMNSSSQFFSILLNSVVLFDVCERTIFNIMQASSWKKGQLGWDEMGWHDLYVLSSFS